MHSDPILLPNEEGTMTPLQLSAGVDDSCVGRHSCAGGKGSLTVVSLDATRDVLKCHLCCFRLLIPRGIAKRPAEFQQWCQAQASMQK